ncbi:MAG: RNA-directed DNA polymerase [Candidatus Gracilibacteria bacterium]|nr:RNA-directed DNA polymerase [Candidatus Gracilibacteria bacterium]
MLNINKQKLLYDLFKAYYDARKNKRNTLNQLDFEFNLEENLINLGEELFSGKYEVGRSIYFIQNHPVKREVFAGDFRDRVVHHLIYNYISPIFEKEFIYDSYSCRKGKGTSLGIKRVSKFIRSCSENYTKDCYVLKLDISGYFMSINKDILFEKIERVLRKYCYPITLPFCHPEFSSGSIMQEKCTKHCIKDPETSSGGHSTKISSNFSKVGTISSGELIDFLSGKEGQYSYIFLMNLIKKVIYNDCTKNSVFRGKREDYLGLPKNKSLFYAKKGYGLPIGNLTSQLFSNIYLSDFDKFLKKELNIKYYGRYVDDFIIIHKDKDFLVSLIEKTKKYLNDNLGLIIHSNKIYLQHYSKGVLFLGAYINPYRVYIRKRTIGYFYKKIQKLNTKLKNNDFKLDDKIKQDFLSTINSYLGMLNHYKAYKITKKLLINCISSNFLDYFYISKGYTKIMSK